MHSAQNPDTTHSRGTVLLLRHRMSRCYPCPPRTNETENDHARLVWCCVATGRDIGRAPSIRRYQLTTSENSPLGNANNRPHHTNNNKIVDAETDAASVRPTVIVNSIYRGILTGFNEAFVVTESTREHLIAEDAASAQLLKPILRGRDIRRYHAQWANLWLLDVHNGYDSVGPIDIAAYPAIKSHLDRYYAKLEVRQDRGITPYNLRNCAYHAQFCGNKLFWPDLSPRGRFVLSKTEMYCTNTGYIMKGSRLGYLCGLLNSPLVSWYLQKTAVTTGEGLIRWIRSTVERIPIPIPDAPVESALVRLVEQRSRVAGTADRIPKFPERRIDEIVYGIYGLDADEVSHIEHWAALKP